MPAYLPPRRVTSTPTTITVNSSSLPSWIPAAGQSQFNNVYRSDIPGTIHLANSVDPDFYMADGSPQVYANRPFAGSGGTGFLSMWNSQAGGAYHPGLGQYGSILLFAGGHFTYNGNGVARFDIATGKWEMFTYPIYASVEKQITGGTVATLTGTVSNLSPPETDATNRFVSEIGVYFTYMDGTAIPGAGNAQGVGVTNWQPYPIHSNCGICALPSDAGGGTAGSLIIAGHDQTGIRQVKGKEHVFRLDCATKLWSGVLVGDLAPLDHSDPCLEYDSTHKLMWYFPVSGGGSNQPIVLDYKQSPFPARHEVTGPAINFTGNYMAGVTYMPSRQLMVYMIQSSVGAPSNDAWFRYPRIWAFRTSTYVFGDAGFNPIPFEVNCSPSADYYRDQILLGLNTGWPGYRTGAAIAAGESTWKGATDSGNLMTGGAYGPRGNAFGAFSVVSNDTISVPGIFGMSVGGAISFLNNGSSFPSSGITTGRAYYIKTIAGTNITVALTSGGVTITTITSGSGDAYQTDVNKNRGPGDKFEYCELEDCLIFIERHLGTENGVPMASQTQIKLWKLTPPAIGLEASGTWVWSSEILSPAAGCVGAAQSNVGDSPAWGGKTRYIPALKCAYYTDRPSLPVQVVRSSTWI